MEGRANGFILRETKGRIFMNGNNNTFFSRNVPAIVSCISWVRLKFLVCNFQGKKFEAKKARHAVNLLHSKPGAGRSR